MARGDLAISDDTVDEEVHVFHDDRGWMIHYGVREYGPYRDGIAALRAAVQVMEIAWRMGRSARIQQRPDPAWSRRSAGPLGQ